MIAQDQSVYEFGQFQLNPAERLLLRDGKPVPLTSKAFEILLDLVRRSGHLVEKSELISSVWGDTFVEEGNLHATISMLRKILGDNRNEPKFIETVAKQGYRFIAEVRQTGVHEGEALPAAAFIPQLTARSFSWRKSASLILRVSALVLVAAVIVGVVATRRTSQASRPQIRSLAILPFQTAGSDSSDVPLGSGIADDLATRLGASGRVTVRPTSALMKYASGPIDPLVAGREQKVDAIIAGNIIRSDGRIHVSAQLLEVSNGAILWAGTFERPVEQMLDLENQMEDAVSRSVSSDQTQSARVRPETRDPEAHELYLEGRYFWNKRTEDGLRRSIEYFQRATIQDQGYAEAYAGLADSYTLLASYGVEPAEQAYPNAKAAALKALQLDQSLAEAHTSLGMVSLYYEWDWVHADAEFRRAIELNPNYPTAHTWYALELSATGRHQEALDHAQRAVDLDPLSLIANTELGRVYYWGRDYDKAIAAFKHAIDLDPFFSRAHTRLGMAYAAQGDYHDAIVEFQKVEKLSGPDPYLDGLIGYAEGRNGDTVVARGMLDDLNRRSLHEFIPAYSMALVCIGLGERDRSLDWFAKSYQDRSTYMVYSDVDPLLDPVRSAPQFSALMIRMGFTQIQAERVAPPAGTSTHQQASSLVN